MRHFPRGFTLSSSKGFTLIELLIVIGILAVLATTAVIVLNPTEFMKKSRDATRLSDLATVNKAISLYQTDGGTSYGDSTTVYVSIPDSSATCANLGLPNLPAGYSYACALEDNYMKADGDGWIPIDFTSVSYGTVLSTLPVDPTNTVATGQYYTYVPGGSWKLAAMMESEKYSINMNIDGGPDLGLYELGSDLTLAPFQRGLVGYWKFDEGSGTTATDSSGNGNNGTVSGAVYASGQVNGALNFDGVDDQVIVSNDTTLQLSQAFTITAWIYWSGYELASYKALVGKSTYWNYGLFFEADERFRCDFTDTGAARHAQYVSDDLTGISAGWYYLACAYDANSDEWKGYNNGETYFSTTVSNATIRTGIESLLIGGYGVSNFHLGYIDDVRIYNRALSASEIKSIYDATK